MRVSLCLCCKQKLKLSLQRHNFTLSPVQLQLGKFNNESAETGLVTREEAAFSSDILVPHTLTLTRTHAPSAVPVHPLALTFLPSSHVASLTHPGLVVRRCQAGTRKMFREKEKEKSKDFVN